MTTLLHHYYFYAPFPTYANLGRRIIFIEKKFTHLSYFLAILYLFVISQTFEYKKGHEGENTLFQVNDKLRFR